MKYYLTCKKGYQACIFDHFSYLSGVPLDRLQDHLFIFLPHFLELSDMVGDGSGSNFGIFFIGGTLFFGVGIKDLFGEMSEDFYFALQYASIDPSLQRSFGQMR